MLELMSHQAAGLKGLAPHESGQLIAMVSHGDERGELPLLWRLCSTLVELGYAATVLDATTAESQNNPGLEQLLEYGHCKVAEDVNGPVWTVIPAARGIQDLCAGGHDSAHALEQLGGLFSQEGIIILYAKAEWIVALLEGSAAEPLLAVSSTKNALLTSYLALKRLLINGTLTPTIVNICNAAKRNDPHQSNIAKVLMECTKNFLGFDAKAMDIALSEEDGSNDDSVRRLALRLVEGAVPLPCIAVAPATFSRTFPTLPAPRSH